MRRKVRKGLGGLCESCVVEGRRTDSIEVWYSFCFRFTVVVSLVLATYGILAGLKSLSRLLSHLVDLQRLSLQENRSLRVSTNALVSHGLGINNFQSLSQLL